MAGAVQLGDNRQMIVEEMGSPTGEISAGSVTVMFFPRGEIRLRDGAVSSIDLVSETELAAQQAAMADELVRLDAARAERTRRLEVEGRAELAARKSSPDFMQLNATEQLASWRSFAARYPMISIAEELATLRERFGQEQRLYELDVANEQRMAELEDRLADAEARAERAERLARNRSGYRSGLRFSGYPNYSRRINRNRSRDRDNLPEATSPGHPADAARGEAMGAYDQARREIYSQSDARP